MATPPKTFFPRTLFFGPYRDLVPVRSFQYLDRYRDCMLVAAEAQDLEEKLSDIEASESELVCAAEAGGMANSTWEFGRSQMTQKKIDWLVEQGYLQKGAAKVPGKEIVPEPPSKEYAVVF